MEDNGNDGNGDDDDVEDDQKTANIMTYFGVKIYGEYMVKYMVKQGKKWPEKLWRYAPTKENPIEPYFSID